MRYEVLTAVKMPMLFLWVVTLCGLVGKCQHSGVTYCLHLPPEHWYLPTSRHSIATKKININIFTTVRTSNFIFSLSEMRMEAVCSSKH
jgi:hypothetical protein